jgi:hypothetical protein
MAHRATAEQTRGRAMDAHPRMPATSRLAALRREVADAPNRPDDAVADLLTTGYAYALELEADELATGRLLDDLLASGREQEALDAARRQRRLRTAARALREELDALAASRRLRRAGAARPSGP